MSKEYDALMEQHPLHQQLRGRWKYLLNSFIGGQIYSSAGYLTRYAYESETEYHERLAHTPLDNHCKGVINVYNSFLFRESAERDFGSIATDPALMPFLEDCDLEGRTLDAFLKDVSTYSSIFGHTWMLLVKPQTNARTRADELAQEIRPYLNLLTPLAVLDWRYERAPSGVYYLAYLKYIEDTEFRGRTVIKEWTEQDITTTVLNDDKKAVEEKTIEVNGLGQIPAVCVYNQRSTMRGIGFSDIEDISDAQRFLYNLYSEIDQSTRISGHPSLCKTADVEAVAGAGAIIQMPENLDPGLKPYMLSVATDTASMWDSVTNTIESIDRMGNTGSVRAKTTRTMSGVAMEVEFNMLAARLSEKADNLEVAEESMWRLWARYQAKVWDGEIDYPDSFSINDEDKEFNNLVKAKSAANDPVLLRVIDEKLLELLGEEKERLAFVDPNPQTGRTYADGEAIPDSLPNAYQPADNPAVPEGQNCANCEYYKPGELYCTKFDAPVRAVYWCAKWEPTED